MSGIRKAEAYALAEDLRARGFPREADAALRPFVLAKREGGWSLGPDDRRWFATAMIQPATKMLLMELHDAVEAAGSVRHWSFGLEHGRLVHLSVVHRRCRGDVAPSSFVLSRVRVLEITCTGVRRPEQARNEIPGGVKPQAAYDQKLPHCCHLMPLLERLVLHGNLFQGPLPDFSNSSHLTHLDLTRNRLSGLVPESLGQCRTLRCLRLGENDFDGPLPGAVGFLSNLTHLDLSGSPFADTRVPYEWGRLSSLQYLDMSSTKLIGRIPIEFGQLGNLLELRLHNSPFSGKVPRSFMNLLNLRRLDLRHCKLEGKPLHLCACKALTYCDISDNKFDRAALLAKHEWMVSLLPKCDAAKLLV